MKKIIVTAIIVCSFAFSVNAQNSSASLSDLLTSYYAIKDALVGSDAATAALKAGDFLKNIKGIDMKTLSDADRSTFITINEKLAFDAEHISESKDIAHQRDHFKTFSDNLFTLAKAVKLSANPVYQQYCPMKKSSWLSSEAAIKNPYYGSAMLSCGSVKTTF